MKNAKIKHNWGFIPLKRLKKGTVEDLFHRKCSNKVRLWIYSIENVVIRYGCRFIPLKMLKEGTTAYLFHLKRPK